MCGDVVWIGGVETDGNKVVRQNDCVNRQEKGEMEINFRKNCVCTCVCVCVVDRQDLYLVCKKWTLLLQMSKNIN